MLAAYTVKSGLFVIAFKFKLISEAPEHIILLTTFNEDSNIDAPETYKLLEFVFQ